VFNCRAIGWIGQTFGHGCFAQAVFNRHAAWQHQFIFNRHITHRSTPLKTTQRLPLFLANIKLSAIGRAINSHFIICDMFFSANG
jgi:hypothetical protein